MHTSDRVAGAATVATSVFSSELLLGALQHLYRAYQKSSIYPSGHPAIPEALDLAICGLEGVLADREALRIAADRDRLLVDRDHLEESSGTLKSLATLLHDLDIAVLEFRPGINCSELESFVLTLGEARRDGVKGHRLVERLGEKQLQYLDVEPIDYDTLSFNEGARRKSTRADGTDVWGTLNAMLTDPPSAEAGGLADPEQLAEEVDRDIQEGTGLEVVREHVSRLSRELNETGGKKRKTGRDWMTRFVSALSPRLRRDLLRIDPRMPEESLALMTDLADLVPESDLLKALQQIDRVGARMPSQLLTLFNKLVRLSQSRPALRPELEKTLGRWGLPGSALDEKEPRLSEVLSEVFQRRASTEFNPQPYQALLDDLSLNALSGDTVPSESLYRDPRAEEDVRLHSAQVAVRLLMRKGDDRHRPAIFARVATEIDLLLAGRKLDDVRDAAVSAHAYSLSQRARPETRRAGKTLLDALGDERPIRLILDHICESGKLSEAARVLLDRGGVAALGPILDTLNTRLPQAVEHQLQEIAAAQDPEVLAKVLRWRAERGGAALRPAFPVIRRLAPDVAARLLTPLLDHREVEVRSRALVALLAVDEPASRVQHLRQGLADEDPQHVALVVRSLADLDSPETLDLLGAYVEGSGSPHVPSLECGVLAARCLTQKGEPGIARLCQCLDALSRSVRPARVRLAVRVRDLLQQHAEARPVAASLGRWRFSRAGWVGRLLPRRRIGQSGSSG
jgi:hypothetical protein